MDARTIASERERAVALLSPDRTGVPLQAVTPNPPPGSLGALAGLSWDSDAPTVRIVVYLFADREQAEQVGTVLVEMLDGEVYDARALVNGTLLLVVIARLDHPDAARRRTRVDQVLLAFSDPG